MTDDEPDPLLDLFRIELRESIAALTRGLLALDRDAADAAVLTEMVQAIRTVRGAARILGLPPVAELAAGLEGRLAAAQSGGAALARGDTDRCQQAVELLGQLDGEEPSVWIETRATEAAMLTAALAGRPAASSVSAPTSPRPVVAAPTAQGFVIDPSMLELFHEEVRGHSAALAAGLIELERDAANPQRIEPLMRAAHSLKGACRIVGLDAAVALAHEMEDGFVAAQAGRLSITPTGIDTLLRAADALATLADVDPGRWLMARGSEVAELRAAVAAINRGDTPPPAAPPPTTIRVEAVPSVVQPSAPPPTESVVRVTAESLNRLMSLAGESLVQARWLQPFAAALTELKKHQDHLAARLDEMTQGLAGLPNADGVARAVTEASRLSARCRQVLAERATEFEDHAGLAEDLNSRLYREVIVSRMRPFSDGAHGFPRLIRDTARMLNKQVRFDLVGPNTEVDRDILERLEAPLTHLLRNATDHGIEPTNVRIAAGKPAEGVVRLEARHRGGMLSITVQDDGAGVDVERLRRKVIDRGHAPADMAARMTEAELLEFLFLPGFSTASQVTEVSGRGVGLDVVLDTVRKVGGSVHVTTVAGRGTTFHLLLPLTLSVVRAVLVDVAGEPYAFPHNRIDRLLRVRREEIQSLQHRQFIAVGDRNVGLVFAAQLLDLPDAKTVGSDLSVVLLSDSTGIYGLIVDAFRGEQDLVVRPLDPRLGKVPNVSAAAVLDDGSPVLIADVEDLIRSMDRFIQTGTLRRCEPDAPVAAMKKRVLVVDDSITVREVQKQILRTRGYDVEVAVDGQDGWHKLRAGRFDLLVSDVDMPRMTGLELVRRLRDDTRLRDLPVVIVSYKDREEDRLRGLEAGANSYLTKTSFHDDSFAEAVVALIGAP